MIIAKLEIAINWLMLSVTTTEYGVGVAILAFCYVSIVAKSNRSKQRLQAVTSTKVLNSGTAAEQLPQGEDSEQALGSSMLLRIYTFFSLCLRRRNPPGRTHPPSPPNHQSDLVDHSILKAACSTAQEDKHKVKHTSAAPCSRNSESEADHTVAPQRKTDVSPRLMTASMPDRMGPRQCLATTSAPSGNLSNIAPQTTKKYLSPDTYGTDPIHSNDSRRHDSSSILQLPDQDDNVTTSNNGMILQPLKLPQPTTHGSGIASTSQARVHIPPTRPSQTRGRIDIVATVSMTAFIIILFATTFPYVLGAGMINRYAECVIMADQRILSFVIMTASMGAAAVLGPVVLVVFSANFRAAFRSTWERIARRVIGGSIGGAA